MLHQLHIMARSVSCCCKRERSIALPSIVFYLAASTYPLLTHAGQRFFLFAKVIFAAGRGVHTTLLTVVHPLYCVILAASRRVLRAALILTSRVSLTSSTAALWAQPTFRQLKMWTPCHVPSCPHFCLVFQSHRLRVLAHHRRTSNVVADFCLRVRLLPRSHRSFALTSFNALL